MSPRHSPRPRPMRQERSLEERDDAPSLTDQEERTLEAIRRQLDAEFGRSAEWLGPPPGDSRDARGDKGTRPKRSPSHRASGRVIGALVLLACAAGGAAGTSAVIRHLKRTDLPKEADRQGPRPSPMTATPRAAQTPSPVSPAPAPEVVQAPRPEPGEPGSTAQTPPPVSPAPAPEVVRPPRPEPGGPRSTAQTRRPSSLAPTPKVVTVPRAAVYYYDGRYFRYTDRAWLVADRQDGPWDDVAVERVPPPVLALPRVYGGMSDQLKRQEQ